LGASSHSVALSGAATAQLHLDLMKRSLSSFVAGDRGRKGWEPSVKELTSNLATGPVSCDDAGGTACLEAYALTFRGFGLAGESYGSASSPGAVTSLSLATLTHLQLAVERVLERGVPGDLIEAGVFRGGATILMRAALAAHADGALLAKAAGPDGGKRRELRPELRRVFVADSFAGIPASRRAVADGLTEECDGWEERYAVDDQTVRSNFRRYGMLDARVVLVKGFFNVSLPPIFSKAPEADEADEADEAPELAVVRIDADAYDGVRDALEALYPRLSVGGMVIIDDWHLVAAAAAAHEYRRKHGVTAPIFLVPSDYLYTCSVGGRRVPQDPNAPQAGGAYGASFAGSAAGSEAIRRCDHPRLSLFLHNKHLITKLAPHVAYWTKGD